MTTTSTKYITLKKFEVGLQELKQADDGRYDLVKTPVAVVEASSMTKGDIRAAIKNAGAACPRGAEVYAKAIGGTRYYYEVEGLKRIATRTEEF